MNSVEQGSRTGHPIWVGNAGAATHPASWNEAQLNPPFPLISVGQFLSADAPTEYLVEGLLECGVNAGIVGPPGSGKSLLALNLAVCVATGNAFHGRPVSSGLAVYLCGEGHAGLRGRIKAIEKFWQTDLSKAPLVVSRCAASLTDPREVERVFQSIEKAKREHGLELKLLVVDTLARFIAPGDESKAQDMGAYMAALDRLRGTAAVFSCHHPGHGDQSRARGSSNWKASLDCEYSIVQRDGVFTLQCQKMKDGETQGPLHFRKESVTWCRDDNGDIDGSIVLVPTEEGVGLKGLTGRNQKKLYDELRRLAEADPTTGFDETGLRAIARALGMKKGSARDVVTSLINSGHLKQHEGRFRCASSS